MKIAIDVSPIKNKNLLQHRVRGVGFYIRNLIDFLEKSDKTNQYLFFSQGEKLPEDVDLIHYPYFEPFFLSLPFFNKKPFVVTVHDLTPLVFKNKFPSGVRGKIKWKIQEKRLKRARRIITDSDSSKNDIIKFAKISEDRIDVIYLAANETFKKKKIPLDIVKKLRAKYKLPDKFALYVGDVTWNKNLPSLVEAVRKAKVPLVMVGKALKNKNFDRKNPWNQDLIKTQNLSEKYENIRRIGFVENKDLVILYNIATIFVMPSFYEGFGLPILEAMSCGCPVITSREGSIPEVAGDAAYYVDAYDTESIALGILKVFNSEKIQNDLINKGLARVKEFSWKKTADQTKKTYLESILR